MALQYWQYTKLWGMANGQIGWAHEPIDYIEAITALEAEQNAMEQEQMDKHSNKSKDMAPKEGKVSKQVVD